MDTWYFAYGSNLDVDQKEQRTGKIRRAQRALLVDFRIAFNKRGMAGDVKANIVPAPGGTVWGVVYLCDKTAMKRMDEKEGLAAGHYRHLRITVIGDSGERFEALTYVACDKFVCEEGKPTAEYLNKIVQGAKSHGLPEDYVQLILKLGSFTP